ncbi:MAG TPA: HAD-IC family P-type ATPase, partial [Gammaproteobacteria bacterium]|nr:HAD-IC family P-type ATPase [Gammaproteobacteria bacterium]
AAVTFLGWVLFSAVAWQQALLTAISVLIITCPCALALATPTALVVATGELSKRGVLAARGEALETISQVGRVVFDKTGTLTRGRLRLSDWAGEPEALARAGALEQASEHPVAAALVQAAGSFAPEHPEALENFPGRGVSGRLSGRRYWVGSYGWVAEQAGPAPEPLAHRAADMDDRGETVVGLASEQGWEAVLGVSDEVRNEAEPTIRALRERGWTVTLVTGDSEAAAGTLAEKVGIGEVYARQRPEDKLALVRGWQHDGEVVAVVGDGLNDGPVLAGADVSLAMGAGVQAARASADFILLSNRLERIPEIAHIGSAALHNIRQNLTLSFGYNALAVPLAALGLVAPLLAAVLMPASSLVVVGNALRLRGLGRGRSRRHIEGRDPAPAH